MPETGRAGGTATSAAHGTGTGAGESNTAPAKPDIPPSRSPVVLSPVPSGFSLKLRDDASDIKLVTGRVAYKTTGNAFRKWVPSDFGFGEGSQGPRVQCSVSGGGPAVYVRNEFELEVTAPKEFEATFTGFDPNRDLVVDFRGES
jgi:hypothetical protein